MSSIQLAENPASRTQRRRLIQWGAVVFLFLAAVATITAVIRHQARPQRLTTVQDVRNLNAEDLRGAPFVRLTGHCTYSDSDFNTNFFVDERGDGIAFDTPDDGRSCAPGTRAELSGIAFSGSPVPRLVKVRVREFGALDPIQSLAPGTEQLGDVRYEYAPVRLKGIVEDAGVEGVGRLYLKLQVGDRSVETRVLTFSSAIPEELIDSEVEIRGVLETVFDMQGRPAGFHLFVNGLKDIVTKTQATPPAQLPRQTVAGASSETSPFRHHRVRLTGTIFGDGVGTRSTLTDETGAIALIPASREVLPTGHAEVLGFIAPSPTGLVLAEARTASSAQEDSSERPTYTDVRSIRHISSQQATRHDPVKFRSVLVTYFDPVLILTFVQDRTGGIYVDASRVKTPSFRAGDLVDLDGVLDAGGFAPQIKVSSPIRVVGHTSVSPSPAPVSLEDVLTGGQDSNWVELSGIVKATRIGSNGFAELQLGQGPHVIEVQTLRPTPFSRELIGAQVRVRGACGSAFAKNGEFLGVVVYVANEGLISVERPATRPAELPLVRVRDVLGFSPNRKPGERIRVRGLITLFRPEGPTYVQEATGGLLIRNHDAASLQVGDEVEALGFIEHGGVTTFLRSGRLEKTGERRPVTPRPVIAQEIVSRGCQPDLVTIDATVVNYSSERGSAMELASGNIPFRAELAKLQRLPPIQAGAVVRLTGICRQQTTLESRQAITRGFSIALRDADDVRVLQSGPWWTAQRLMIFLASLAAATLAILAWLLLLRHRVREQTELIELKLGTASQTTGGGRQSCQE